VRTSILFATALLTAATLAPAQQITLPLWPQGSPEKLDITGPERETTTPSDHLVAGRPVSRLTDVSQPTLAVYKAKAARTPATAVVVFPGGGYKILAYDLEGTEVCDWLNSTGVTCVLVKYHVPVDKHYPDSVVDLEDAQQAMRLTRMHAAEWQIDPQRIGVLGFSAGGHLATAISNHPDYQREGAPENNMDARPNFAVIVYPGYLADPEKNPVGLVPGMEPNAKTPPTFLVQAEDDPVHEENALFYYQALKLVKVPAELHLFAEGGHGYGLRPTDLPVTHWPAYVEIWLHSIHMLDGYAQPAVAVTPAGSRP
jgi:acetyl esterase/lipase